MCYGKDYCVSGNFFVFWKDCCFPELIVVFAERLLMSSEKGCCVLEKVIVFEKIN